MPFPSPERLARIATRHPWLVIGAWVIFLVAGAASASRIGDALTTGQENYKQTESIHANDLLADRLYGELPGKEVAIVRSETKTVDDPEFRALVASLTDGIRGLKDDVRSVVNFTEAGDGSGLISDDRHATILPIVLAGDLTEAEDHAKPVMDLLAEFNGKDGYTVLTGGDGSISAAFTETSRSDLEIAEIVGLPIALVILAVVFGALVAAGIPVLLALVGIILALGITAIVGQVFELSIFVTNMVTTMGLAVGIDYSLLVVQRVREERGKGRDRDAAIIKAGGTASRAVLFSGLAVMAALSGMLLVPNSIFRSLGAGAIIVVIVEVLAALTLLPAVLRVLGDKIDRVRIRIPGLSGRVKDLEGHGGFWDRSSAIVMKHPVISVVASVTLLVGLMLPYATIELGWAGVSSLPEKSVARQAYDILGRDFSAGQVSPADIVIDTEGLPAADVQAAATRLAAAMAATGNYGEASIVSNEAGTLTHVTAPINFDPQGDAARDVVINLRDDLIPAAFGPMADHVFVTGITAQGMDDTSVITGATIPVFAFVLGLSFVILLVVFHSIVVPLKAIVMNLLSVGAAYGLMVLVFQHGFLADTLGFQQVERIETWVPLFMFAILFGLSMDYHVFLLTRIRERFDHTHDNRESVAYGVRTTAGIITGAAAIMVAVFSGFALGQLVMFQQMGFGLAVAVFLDVTVVRTVLVPAAMELLGDANWYLPSWLRWIPKVDIEGTASDQANRHPLPEGAVGQ